MASPTSSPRFQLTLPNGIVLGCNTPEDLTVALVAFGRSADALSVQPSKEPRRRKPKTSDATSLVAGFGPGAAWSPKEVKRLLNLSTDSAVAMLKAAIELGPGATAAELARKLETRPGALGPMIGKLGRDAQGLAPYLPTPLHTEGRPGHKVLVIDPTFLNATKEVLG